MFPPLYFNFLKACGATQWSTQCNKSKYHASQSPSPNLAIRSLHALYSFCWAGQCFLHSALRAGRWSTTSSSDCCFNCLFVESPVVCEFYCGVFVHMIVCICSKPSFMPKMNIIRLLQRCNAKINSQEEMETKSEKDKYHAEKLWKKKR